MDEDGIKAAGDAAGTPFISRWDSYITADGFGRGAIASRLERLKFETIVQQKTIAEVLSGIQPPPGGQ